ncbi:MAG TPA: sialidase family protein [Nitrococcus sp.]|nr:sialidase family protein [Nitrococcus sp.]
MPASLALFRRERIHVAMVMTVESRCRRNGLAWYRPLLLTACGVGLAFATAATSAHGMDHMDMDHVDHRGQTQALSAECLANPVRVACAPTATAAFDSKGRLWLVWAVDGHVYVQRSADRGERFSAPVAVNATAEPMEAGGASGELRPQIAVDAAGTVYVAWTRKLSKRYSGEIRFSRSDDGGRHFSPPVTVNDDRTVTSHAFVVLGIGAGDRVYLAWLDGRDRLAAEAAGRPDAGSALYYAVSRDGGRSFQPNRRLAAATCECCRIALAMDPVGRPVLLWRGIYGDQIRDHSLIAFQDADTPGPIRRVSHDGWRIDACPHHGPGLAVAEDGVIHAAWFDNAPERHGLFYARSPDRGAHFSVPMPFGDYDRQAGHPSVLAVGKRVYLAWQEFDGERTYIRYRRSDDGGRSWTEARQAASTSGWADHPFLVSDGTGIYLSWLTRAEGYRLLGLEPR